MLNYNYPTGQKLLYAVRRPSDGAMLDPSSRVLGPPAEPFAAFFPAEEEASPHLGSYLIDVEAQGGKAGLDGAFEVSVRLASAPTVAIDSFPIYFRDGKALTVAAIINEVVPGVAAEVKAAIDQVGVFVRVGRLGGLSS